MIKDSDFKTTLNETYPNKRMNVELKLKSSADLIEIYKKPGSTDRIKDVENQLKQIIKRQLYGDIYDDLIEVLVFLRSSTDPENLDFLLATHGHEMFKKVENILEIIK